MGSPNQMSLVQIPSPAYTNTGEDGMDDYYIQPALTSYKKMPAHAALVMLSRMQHDDDIILARADTSCVWTLATMSKKSITLMMTNYLKDTVVVSSLVRE